jgi:hypothetical protein
LSFLASLVRSCHGAQRLILRCALGEAEGVASGASDLRDTLQRHVLELSKAKQRRSRRAVTLWARLATEGQAHASTKVPEAGTWNSALASK